MLDGCSFLMLAPSCGVIGQAYDCFQPEVFIGFMHPLCAVAGVEGKFGDGS